MKQLPENWTENTEANEDSIFLTQEERDSASVEKMNWEILFPDVSFKDKICVVYIDGTEEIYKHLYVNSFVLEEINWVNVTDCFEV